MKILLKVTLNLFELFLIWCLTWQPDLHLIEFLPNFYTNPVDKVDELVVRTDQGKYTILPQFVAFYLLDLNLKTAPTNVLLILPFWLYPLLKHVNIGALKFILYVLGGRSLVFLKNWNISQNYFKFVTVASYFNEDPYDWSLTFYKSCNQKVKFELSSFAGCYFFSLYLRAVVAI